MRLPIPRNFKPNKTWIILGVALGVGLLAALAASSYLSNQLAAIEARARGKTVAVIVAKRDLAKGTKLSADNVAVRTVPQDFAHSVAIVPDQFGRIDGQTMAYSVKGGDMILWGLTENKKTSSFSSRVGTGHRAMTVAVDEINSISGLLEPGDIIDVIVTIDQKGKKITFPLLQSVQIMATGQRSVDDPKSGERRQYSTVTIDTTPEQAQRIIIARESGKITALLRNPDDKQPIANARGDLAALLGIKDGAFAADGRQVPVLYGGSSGKLPVEGLKLGQYIAASKAGQFGAAQIAASLAEPAAAPGIAAGLAQQIPIISAQP
jgi:pilus assembly protein CpaB